ncbi:hypothetical protein [Sporolactobacillus putidus]|uniref:Uncharacterized protein n=1 Tax=Sporolactobacillus putidus TaxID=492735 RepID=A0A917S664_9BACL|nr:hypothetical protein [Sporolactobacillus putidus]GGL57492.1 hypothetical protein GCM10007968_21870 [Sporolactobacillus putidus]
MLFSENIDDAKKEIAGDKKKIELENIRETPLDGPQSNFGNSNSTFEDGTSATVTSVPVYPDTPQVKESPKNAHFYMSARLDNTRTNRDVSRLVDEIISHLTSIDGSDVDISLDVNATVKKGIPQNTVRTVSENCRTLKVTDFGFDE